MVKAVIGSTLLCGVLLGLAVDARAGETLADVFDRIHRSIVAIRTTELDVAEDGDGQTAVTSVGSSEIHAEFPGAVSASALACVRRRAPSTSRRCSSSTCRQAP